MQTVKKLLSLLLIPLASISNSVHAETVSEYAIKAVFLEKFTHFITWPEHSNTHKLDTPFNICVLGNNPFGQSLDKLARASTIKDKTIIINYLSANTDVKIDACDIVFISKIPPSRLATILNITSRHPVLTVSDTPGFCKYGVMINYYPRKQSIGFEINLQAAKLAGFQISSRLLKLSRQVEGKVMP